jgi:hypothetical protein
MRERGRGGEGEGSGLTTTHDGLLRESPNESPTHTAVGGSHERTHYPHVTLRHEREGEGERR